jgi:hypothetical protein
MVGSSLWKVEGKYASFTEGTLNRNKATMGLRDVFDNGKSQARAAEFPTPPLVNAVETLKEPGEMLRGYTASMIADPNDNFVCVSGCFNFYCFARLAVFDGIIEEVADRLLELALTIISSPQFTITFISRSRAFTS